MSAMLAQNEGHAVLTRRLQLQENVALEIGHSVRRRDIALLKHLQIPEFLLWDESSTGRPLTRRSPQPVASLTLGAYRIVLVGYKPRNNRMYLHQQTPHARKMHDCDSRRPPCALYVS